VVAPDMLQHPSVKRWLGGIEPAWTLLDFNSFAALGEPPSPIAGPIRLAADLTQEELRRSPLHGILCFFCVLPRMGLA
jgi:hypothetical protein